VAHNFIQYY